MIETNDDRDRYVMLLSKCPAQKLAETLVDLSIDQPMIFAAVERLIATPAQNLKRFRNKLEVLTTRFDLDDDWVSEEFRQLIADLESAEPDPDFGLQAVLEILEGGRVLIEHYGDEDESISDAISGYLPTVFAGFAAQAGNPEQAWESLLVYHTECEYSHAFGLIKKLIPFVPQSILLSSVDDLLKGAGDFDPSGWAELEVVAAVALHLQDPRCFEEVVTRSKGLGKISRLFQLARLYQARDNPQAALKALKRIRDKRYLECDDYRLTLIDIHQSLGQHDQAQVLATAMMEHRPNPENFSRLQALCGYEVAVLVLEKAERELLERNNNSSRVIGDLMAMGRVDTAEQLVRANAGRLDFDGSDFQEIAEGLMNAKRPLAAALLYRRLVTNILNAGRSDEYGEAVASIRCLHQLTADISDWDGHADHCVFMKGLKQQHSRKRGFWGRMSDAGLS